MIRASKPPGFRLVQTKRGDTPQDVAARELGDASRWGEIVAINGLSHPYIVDSIAELEAAPAGRVTLSGKTIKVPAPPRRTSAVPDDDIYGTDQRLDPDGRLAVDAATGDWATVSGPKNLTQALRNRLRTPLGQLTWHRTYGNGVFRLLGKKGSAARGQLAAVFIRRAVAADTRVDRAENARADVSGDHLRCSVVAVATDGKPLPVAIGDEKE